MVLCYVQPLNIMYTYDTQTGLDTLSFQKLRVPIDLNRNEWAHFIFIYAHSSSSVISFCHMSRLYSRSLLVKSFFAVDNSKY